MMKLISSFNPTKNIEELKLAVDDAISKRASIFIFVLSPRSGDFSYPIPHVDRIEFYVSLTGEEELQYNKEELLKQLEEINNKLLEYEAKSDPFSL